MLTPALQNVSFLPDADLCRAIARMRGLASETADRDRPYMGWHDKPATNERCKYYDIRYCDDNAAAWELLVWATGQSFLVKNECPGCHGYDGRIAIRFEFFSNYWTVEAEVEPDPPTGDMDHFRCGSFREGKGIECPRRALAEAVYLALLNSRESAQ